MAESKEINDLASRVGDLRRKLAEAERALHDARVRASGVSVGQMVMRRGGEFGRVAGVQPHGFGKAWVTVNRRLKDGSWGSVSHRWFDEWEVVPSDAGAPPAST